LIGAYIFIEIVSRFKRDFNHIFAK
jgi:hypothetical protein